MNVIKKYTKLVWLGAAAVLSACSQENVTLGNEVEYTSATIDVQTNVDQSRAVTPFPSTYQGHYYLYEDQNLSGNYVYIKEGIFPQDAALPPEEAVKEPVMIKLEQLRVGANYKVVMMGVPKTHSPQLPSMTSLGDRSLPYSDAFIPYLDNTTKNPESSNIFRDILTFKASPKNTDYNAVLTRQNGALEVRIKNRKMKKVALYVNGTKTVYLNDGTGGQVLSKDPFALSKTLEGESLAKPEVRIRVNLLPQENIAADAGKTGGSAANDPQINTADNRLVITDSEGQAKTIYLKSDQGAIPIYPNQVTWLTLGSDGGSFEVGFSGNINLEDPNKWDGWIPQP